MCIPRLPQLPKMLSKHLAPLRAGMVGAGTRHSTRAHACTTLVSCRRSLHHLSCCPVSKPTQGMQRTFRATWPSLVQHTQGTTWRKQKPTISLPYTLAEEGPCLRGGRSRPVSGGGTATATSAPATRTPEAPAAGACPPHGDCHVAAARQPGHPPALLWWGPGPGQGQATWEEGRKGEGH